MNRYSDQLIFDRQRQIHHNNISTEVSTMIHNNPFNYGAKIKLQFTLHKS